MPITKVPFWFDIFRAWHVRPFGAWEAHRFNLQSAVEQLRGVACKDCGPKTKNGARSQTCADSMPHWRLWPFDQVRTWRLTLAQTGGCRRTNKETEVYRGRTVEFYAYLHQFLRAQGRPQFYPILSPHRVSVEYARPSNDRRIVCPIWHWPRRHRVVCRPDDRFGYNGTWYFRIESLVGFQLLRRVWRPNFRSVDVARTVETQLQPGDLDHGQLSV